MRTVLTDSCKTLKRRAKALALQEREHCDVIETNGLRPPGQTLASFPLSGLTLVRLTAEIPMSFPIDLADPRYAQGIEKQARSSGWSFGKTVDRHFQ
jgi:hypothetical protein